MARARVPAPATLVALFAVVAMAATGACADDGSVICGGLRLRTPDNSTSCDTAKCGKGSCSEVSLPIPTPGTVGYKCTCDPGWSHQQINLTFVDGFLDWMPCMVPDCSFSSACRFNVNLTIVPPGIPLTDPCVVVDCGLGGACEKGDGFSYQCRCKPGFTYLLNMTSMPCIGGSCTFGPDCAKLGLGNTTAAPAPAPVGNGDLY